MNTIDIISLTCVALTGLNILIALGILIKIKIDMRSAFKGAMKPLKLGQKTN